MYHGYVCMLDCWLVCFIRFRLPSKWWSAKVQITKGAPPYFEGFVVKRNTNRMYVGESTNKESGEV